MLGWRDGTGCLVELGRSRGHCTVRLRLRRQNGRGIGGARNWRRPGGDHDRSGRHAERRGRQQQLGGRRFERWRHHVGNMLQPKRLQPVLRLLHLPRALPERRGPRLRCDVRSDACLAEGISEDDVACVAGRCVLNRNCDDSNVTCEVATPACAQWNVPEVVDGCYTGRCLPVDQCSGVASCKVCEGAGLACAVYVTQLGVQNHCVVALPACAADDCECMGICSDGFICGPGLSCNCLGC